MNKFLTKSSGIDEDAVKKIVNSAIDLSCVTYDNNKTVSIQNSDDDILYTLPKTVGPPGYVIAAGANGDLIFTNSPIPSGPYLTNPLNTNLIMSNFDIVGANHIRPNTLEVATTSILPVINVNASGKNRFNGIIDVDNIMSNRNLINVSSHMTMTPGVNITSDNFNCNGTVRTNLISSYGGSSIVIDKHVDMGASNLRAASVISNMWNPVSTGNTLTIGATISSQNDIMTAGTLWTNYIKPISGTNIAVTSDSVTMNSISVKNCSVAGPMTSISFTTSIIGSRSGTYISIVDDLVLGNNKLFVHNLENVSKISFVPTQTQPVTLLDNLNHIQSNGDLTLSPFTQVVVNSDLDMTQHSIRNANFQDCAAFDNLNAAVAGISEMHDTVTALDNTVGGHQISISNNAHLVNMARDDIALLHAESINTTTSINDIISNLSIATSLINNNTNAITDLATTTQTQAGDITDIDDRLVVIESNATSVNNTVSQKAIAPKLITSTSGIYTSLCGIDTTYISNTDKKIDIVQGNCYDIDLSYSVNIGTALNLTNHIAYGPSLSYTTPIDIPFTVGFYFVNLRYSFVVQSYNPSTKVLAIMYKYNIVHTNMNSSDPPVTGLSGGTISGTNNGVDVNNKLILDIGVKYSGTATITRNFAIVRKII